MNFNKVILIGNLTQSPELRSLPSGQPVTSFGLATNRFWKDQSGQRQQKAEFHSIVLFGKLAETTSKYLQKGSLVLVEGRLQTRSWDDAKTGVKRYKTEIVGENIQFGPKTIGGAPNATDAGSNPTQAESLETIEYPEDDINPEEIPF